MPSRSVQIVSLIAIASRLASSQVIDYLGCYADSNDRRLPDYKGNVGAVGDCSALCESYAYYGLQANGECFCGNDYGRAVSFGTSNGCQTNRLGGQWCFNLFEQPASQYQGCYNDNNDRRLPDYKGNVGAPGQCAVKCNRYRYFGVQADGQCWCGNDYASAVSLGFSSGCPANQLGGQWCFNLFQLTSCYKGCYKDSSDRRLPDYTGNVAAPQDCSVKCGSYAYYGVQADGQCYCGNDYGRAVSFGTSTGCPSSKLGGQWCFDLFEN